MRGEEVLQLLITVQEIKARYGCKNSIQLFLHKAPGLLMIWIHLSIVGSSTSNFPDNLRTISAIVHKEC